ncbi:hypothetical protein KSU1_C1514 [Candidatus Jettenia caeni]|uniref:Uncharacterized protein n=1 Tax=Candidatus Jettenia caeni TaxID=247490 RepID=I3IN15_9BACT|nr:hypothetical protein [Candidatus Jettenia sp. AMX1]GAB63110.1 hypothetical protein KSU1_C1514 [Candidatus Jettenia caeni]
MRSNDKEFVTIRVGIRKDQLHTIVEMKKKTGKTLSQIVREFCDYGMSARRG